MAHSDLVPLYLARQGARGPNAQRLGSVMLELLGRGGLGGEPASEALRVLIVYTIGFAAFAARPPMEAGAPVLTTDEVLANFDSGLRWLLAGIARGRSPAGSGLKPTGGARTRV